MLGTVKWFDHRKGYGFITPNDGSDDLFVHFSDVKSENPLYEGLKVRFEVENGKRGKKAIGVVVG